MYKNYTLQELEKIIVSGILTTRRIDKVCDTLSVNDFTSSKEKQIFKAMLTYFSAGDEDWYVKTYSELKKYEINLIDYMSCSEIISVGDINFYVRELKDLRRKLLLVDLFIDSQSKVKGGKLDDFIIAFDKKFSAITSDKLLVQGDIKVAIAEYENLQQIYSDKIQTGIDIIGIDTGFDYLNKIIDGLRQGHLWILGGYTSSGKTFLALNIVANLIKQKKRIGFYSLEMSKVDIFGRLLGIMSGTNSLQLLKGTTDIKNKQIVGDIKNEIKESKMFLYTELSDLQTIKLSMIRENMKNKVDLFVIDYIQLMQADGKSEYENMKMVITELQRLATQLKVSIIALSQISNEAARNRNSIVMGFKGSGDIGAAADLAIELLPDKDDFDEDDNLPASPVRTKAFYERIVKMVVKKNRHGLTGCKTLTFDKFTGKFWEGDKKPQPIINNTDQTLIDNF